MMAGSHLALLCLIGLLFMFTKDVTSQTECIEPDWPEGLGDNPFDAARGKVLLVALVKGYCHYCMGQATNLELMKNHLRDRGFPEIAMVLVNGGDSLSRQYYDNLGDACNLTSYQDTEDHVLYADTFRGNKDDFVVFDRCGHRVAHIPHPYSYLGYNITWRVLLSVYQGNHHCHCSLDNPNPNIYNQMYADQPVQTIIRPRGLLGEITSRSAHRGQSREEAGGQLNLECENSDRMCRRFERRVRNGRIHHRGRGHNRHRHGGLSGGGHHNHEGDSHGTGGRGHRWGRWHRRQVGSQNGVGHELESLARRQIMSAANRFGRRRDGLL